MIATFLSLKMVRIAGAGLGYAAIVWLNRAYGVETLGHYMFLLNAVIVLGSLAALDLPTLVQRLSVKLDGNRIGAGAWVALRRRWPTMVILAFSGAIGLLALNADHPLTVPGVVSLTVAVTAFAMTLVVIETLRISKGARVAEFQRNITRPSLILLLLLAGLSADSAIKLAVVLSLIWVIWLAREAIPKASMIDAELTNYVAERGCDFWTVVLLGALALVFGAMDVVVFGIIENARETGIYGAGTRYGMLVNVALLAGNAQMVRHVAKVAADSDSSGKDWNELKRQLRMVRIGSTALSLVLVMGLPLYGWLVDLPVVQLWPYFAIATFSFWLQGMIGPVDMFLVQAHEADRLIRYHIVGLVMFGLISGILLQYGTTLAIPLGVAVGANAIKLLCWMHIRRSRGLRL